MNVSERRYMLGRLNEIEMAKLVELGAKRGELKDSFRGYRCTNAEMLEALKSGKVKLSYSDKIYAGVLHPNVKETKIRVNGSSEGYKQYETFFNIDKRTERMLIKEFAKLDSRGLAIRKECTKVKDQVMLGDAEVALAMIAKFEQF